MTCIVGIEERRQVVGYSLTVRADQLEAAAHHSAGVVAPFHAVAA
jgi:hypothetical protein